MKNNSLLQNRCHILIEAFKRGDLGKTIMPEDSHPRFLKNELEDKIAYFTLPMALNYQRNSYDLWEAALKTYNDKSTKFIFEIKNIKKKKRREIQKALLKHKLALQPNKHTDTWISITKAVEKNWGSFSYLIKETQGDFLTLKNQIQIKHKKEFPYLSGPKIFNYWAFILDTYCGLHLKNRDKIEIAPDTHIIKCSIKLGIITEKEGSELKREDISEKWRTALNKSGIDPIDMHSPLWFWSRNGFLFKLK